MGWRATAAALGVTALAGAGGGAWLAARLVAPPPPAPTVDRAPELGRGTAAAAGWQMERVAQLEALVARLTAEQATAAAARYGDALAAALAASRRGPEPDPGTIQPNRGTAFPKPAELPTVPEVAAALAAGELRTLAEQRFGPGPRGDEIEVLAVLDRGGAVQLVGDFLPAKPPRADPLAGVDARLAYVRSSSALAPGFEQFLNAELAAGYARLTTSPRGRWLREVSVEAGYGTVSEAFVRADARFSLLIQARRRE
jgi:hypothetical protein